jgi:hypothetical protein
MLASNLNIAKALEYLLQEKYFAEFETINGLNQHPKGYNFYDWLASKEMITNAERDIINDKIKLENLD